MVLLPHYDIFAAPWGALSRYSQNVNNRPEEQKAIEYCHGVNFTRLRGVL